MLSVVVLNGITPSVITPGVVVLLTVTNTIAYHAEAFCHGEKVL
jgi:hypothetical protein